MIKILTAAQHNLLRRCDGGLRIWEIGPERDALLVGLRVLSQLGLVALDETQGFELTAEGEAWLIDKDR
jgi:hypothetical protein